MVFLFSLKKNDASMPTWNSVAVHRIPLHSVLQCHGIDVAWWGVSLCVADVCVCIEVINPLSFYEQSILLHPSVVWKSLEQIINLSLGMRNLSSIKIALSHVPVVVVILHGGAHCLFVCWLGPDCGIENTWRICLPIIQQGCIGTRDPSH